MSYYVFLVTVPSMEEGEKIAQALIQEELAACVNIIPEIISIYKWKGNVERDEERILIIKTREEKSEKIIHKIEELHSYDTPECIGFEIDKGSGKYLDWIERVVPL